MRDERQYRCCLWQIIFLLGVTRWDTVQLSDWLSKLRFDRQRRSRCPIAHCLAGRSARRMIRLSEGQFHPDQGLIDQPRLLTQRDLLLHCLLRRRRRLDRTDMEADGGSFPSCETGFCGRPLPVPAWFSEPVLAYDLEAASRESLNVCGGWPEACASEAARAGTGDTLSISTMCATFTPIQLHLAGQTSFPQSRSFEIAFLH